MIVTVFNGKNGKWKADYITALENLKIERSLYAFKKSIVTVPQIVKNIEIKAFDLIRIDINGFVLIGRLFEPKYQNDRLELEFTFGADIHQREQHFFDRSVTLTDEEWVNYEYHTLKLAGSHVIVNTDFTLYSDQIVRQAMRKTYCSENMTLANTLITPISEQNFKFRLDDERIQQDSLEVKFVSDTVNELTLINKNTPIQRKTWYLVDGDVTDTFPTDPDFRFVNSVQLVEGSEYQNINKAIELLKKQEYNNTVKFEIEYTMAHVPINKLLGLKVDLYIPVEFIEVSGLNIYKKKGKDVVINTIVGSYQFEKGVLSVEFGLPKTDLTSLLGGV